mmetsp:Transcript_60588/g.131314  ORF Transcript_60588/g.131314 Transcript_60588/m.131314 type:complete len:201 (+) Transcript_60588:921-1523(+)
MQLGELHGRAEPQPLVRGRLQRVEGELVDGLQLGEVARGGHGVQDGVDGLARIVPCDLVHVAQQVAIPAGHLVEAADPRAEDDYVLQRLESPDHLGPALGLQRHDALELLQGLLGVVLLVVVRLVEGVLDLDGLLVALALPAGAVGVIVRLVLELVGVGHGGCTAGLRPTRAAACRAARAAARHRPAPPAPPRSRPSDQA